jgi:hypothetical protein
VKIGTLIRLTISEPMPPWGPYSTGSLQAMVQVDVFWSYGIASGAYLLVAAILPGGPVHRLFLLLGLDAPAATRPAIA